MTLSGRVAVVRLDALGDTLLSTPALDVLCRERGPANVLVITSPGFGEIFGQGPHYQEVSSEEPEETIARHIDDFGAQTVYVFSEKKRALKGAFLSKASERIGFDPGWTQPLRSLEVRRYLTVRFPIVNSLDSSSRYHEVERYCRLVAKGLAKKSVNGGRLKFFTVERPVVSCRLSRPIAFQWAEKWLSGGWPEELLPSLVESLPENTLIFVSPQEEEKARSLLPALRLGQLRCYPQLKDYALQLAKCRYLLSVDTGSVHVAAAMGVPVIDIFPEEGAHHTVPRWRPWMTPHLVVLKPSFEKDNSLSSFLAHVTQARSELEQILQGLVAI